MDAFGIAHLETNEHGDRFNRVIPPIDIIAHKEIVSVRSRSTNSVEFHEIMPLAVDVSADCDGSGDGLDVGFVHEGFSRFFT